MTTPSTPTVAPVTRSHVGNVRRRARDVRCASTPRPNPAVWPSVACQNEEQDSDGDAVVSARSAERCDDVWNEVEADDERDCDAAPGKHPRDEAEPPPADPREQQRG